MRFSHFFVLGGVVLIVSGLLQALVRPHKPGETPMQKVINRATVSALVFVCVGALAIAVGVGALPLVKMPR